MAEPLGPFKLVTVNYVPDRAKMIVARVIEAVKDSYTVIHAGNIESIASSQKTLNHHFVILF